MDQRCCSVRARERCRFALALRGKKTTKDVPVVAELVGESETENPKERERERERSGLMAPGDPRGSPRKVSLASKRALGHVVGRGAPNTVALRTISPTEYQRGE